jgi:hypothetical protein
MTLGNKRNRGRGIDATGRSKGGTHHVRLHDWELRSAAYRSLSIGARALLVELKALYFRNNNGILFLIAREAARRLGCSKKPAGQVIPRVAGARLYPPERHRPFQGQGWPGH